RRQILEEILQDLLDKGFIRPSTSPYASPIVLVPKKNGTYRLCVDYRELNNHIIPIRYPLPRIDDLLMHLVGAKYFSTLDLQHGYHQIKVEETSRPLTAFTTPLGLYEFNVLPFGITTAPAYFQKVISELFADLLYHGVLVYLDDIVIYSETEQEFMRLMKEVLGRLAEYGLRLNKSKCSFATREVEYLGWVISEEGRRISPSRVSDLALLSPPTSRKEVQSFVGLMNYFREFIPNYSVVMEPITRLLNKELDWTWTEEQEKAFRMVIDELQKGRILAPLKESGDLILYTDASSVGIGAVLMQRDPIDGKERPIQFMSKKLTEVQSRWSTVEQEAYAVVMAVLNCESYLRGRPFMLKTDHRNLVYLQKAPNAKLTRWRLRLEEFEFEIEHVPGKDNIIADVLSRFHQGQPKLLASIYTELDDSFIGKVRIAQQTEMKNYSGLMREDGLFVTKDGFLIIPEKADKLKKEILKLAHGSHLVGHHGESAMVKFIHGLGLTWTNLKKSIHETVTTCLICQKTRL
ncbi:Transposon Ty3-G Gag-Pol polyprotein, partial [Aduncisulcus paluster]